jgi:ZIP family zinc transporter
MLIALLVGVVASGALVIGSLLGVYTKPSQRLIAVALGFASGALITALAFELFEPAFMSAGALLASAGLLGGAVVFVAADILIDRHGGSSGFSLLASVTFDGVPESLALGVAVIGASITDTLALVVAIFFSNLPEALGGAAGMREAGRSRAFAVGSWSATAGLLAAAVVLGNGLLAGVGESVLAVVEAFAAGAVLASLADTLMPQAYEQGGKAVALATAVGFLLAFLLTQV